MPFAPPGGSNVVVPTLDLTGNLQVGFSRNAKRFAVNQIAKITPLQKMRGLYLYFNPLSLVRFPGGNTNQNYWAPGTMAPTGFNDLLEFEMREVVANRYCFPATIDQLAVEQATWNITKAHSEALAQKAMTNRAMLVANLITDSTQYDASHVATAATWGGGAWDAGTVTTPYILKGINAAAQVIQKDTQGLLNYKNLTLVMNPNTARKMAQSAEVHDYLARSQWALPQLRGDEKNQNSFYGLPPELYGVKLVIEDATYTGDNKLHTAASPSFAFPDGKAVLLLREEDLVGTESAFSYSAVHIFPYQDMVVESFDDTRNKLMELRVIDNIAVKFVAPVSAALVTSAVS